VGYKCIITAAVISGWTEIHIDSLGSFEREGAAMIKGRWIGVGLWLASLFIAGCGSGEQGKSYLIRHAVVTLSQAAEIAEANVPGRAVKVELESSASRVMYKIDIVDAVNRAHEIWIDAETGKIVK
jgi:hypothetical protein